MFYQQELSYFVFPQDSDRMIAEFMKYASLQLILMFCNKKNYSQNNFGFITSLFLILYGIFRFLIEFLREPDAHIGLIFNSITMGQLLSVPLVIIGAGIYLKTHSK